MRDRLRALLVSAALTLCSCGDDGAGTEPAGAEASACGVWQPANKADRPPADAEAYGAESNSMGTYSQYVCRFQDKVDDRIVMMQGKGVFGFGCYAVLPVSSSAPLRVQASHDFDVLVASKECAKMVPYDSSVRMLPTGADVDGQPTYSCRAVVNSLDVPGESRPLGRFELTSTGPRCLFEWYSNVRAAPSMLVDGDRFEVLATP